MQFSLEVSDFSTAEGDLICPVGLSDEDHEKLRKLSVPTISLETAITHVSAVLKLITRKGSTSLISDGVFNALSMCDSFCSLVMGNFVEGVIGEDERLWLETPESEFDLDEKRTMYERLVEYMSVLCPQLMRREEGVLSLKTMETILLFLQSELKSGNPFLSGKERQVGHFLRRFRIHRRNFNGLDMLVSSIPDRDEMVDELNSSYIPTWVANSCINVAVLAINDQSADWYL